MSRIVVRALMIVAVAGALASTAVSAATVAGEPAAPWVSAQSVQGSTVSLTLEWDPTPGTASYHVYWMQGYGAPAEVPQRQSIGPINATSHVFDGLAPGTMYCFALVSDSTTKVSARSCKVTTPLARAVVPTGLSTSVATFNLRCGSKSKCNSGWKWRTRSKQVVDRIDRTNADVMVFVEAHVAHKLGKKKRRIGTVMAKRGYVVACQTQKRKKRQLFSQVAYVRASAYAVVDARHNSKGSRFTRFGDRDHGFCHALIQHRATGRILAIAATHLRDGNADGLRQQEAAYVLGRVQARFPGQPSIILGDFNSSRGKDYHGESDGPGHVMETAGYADAGDIAARLTYPYLNSAQRFSADPQRASTFPTHVDRIFVSPGITVPLWENIAVLAGNGQYATPMASDHNPIKATLYVP